MGSNWPLLSAHPLGAKLNETIFNSATNGSEPGLPLSGDGNTPNKEMMKFTHRYGMKLSCGWLPPFGPIAAAFMLTLGALAEYSFRLEPAHTPLAGDDWLPLPACACGT